MPATRITDLLPVPENTQQPHAYQIFGLEAGEDDAAVISRAIQETVARLKAVKSSSDPKLWSTAARLVQQARLTLTDPEKKSQLDARFGIVSFADEDPPAGPASGDPLGAVLPATDPLASVLPSSNPLTPVGPASPSTPASGSVPSNPPAAGPSARPAATMAQDQDPGASQQPPPTPAAALPEGVFGTPSQTGDAAPEPEAQVVVKPKSPQRRRRKKSKSVLGSLIFLTFALGMSGLIGVLGYFLIYGSGQVAITSAEGQITISTKPQATPAQPAVSRPQPLVSKPRVVDPVMGDLAGDVPAPPEPPVASGLDQAVGEAVRDGLGDAESTGVPDTVVAMPAEPAMDLDMTAATADPPPAPLSEEVIQEADQAMAEVRDLIRQPNWDEMKQAAMAVTEMAMTQEQKAGAESLLQLVDLATYYRDGIERAVADLSAGTEIAVTDTFRVIVVETDDDLLVLRRNEKSYSFSFDQFSLPLAHKLASFDLPDSPTVRAARAVYQAIAPRSNAEYRAEAVRWLREIETEVEGVDPAAVADTIERLF